MQQEGEPVCQHLLSYRLRPAHTMVKCQISSVLRQINTIPLSRITLSQVSAIVSASLLLIKVIITE